MKKPYDQDVELTRYVWNHYRHLMSDFELRAGNAILFRTKAEVASPVMKKALLDHRIGGINDEEINAALADGFEAFRLRVRRRVTSQHGSEVVVTRCPRCNRIPGHPLARQCFWCGFDWH